MKDLINKSAAERGNTKRNNKVYKQIDEMGHDAGQFVEDIATMMCGGVVGSDKTGTEIIEMIESQAGIDVSRQDLKEMVAGSNNYDNDTLLKNIEK